MPPLRTSTSILAGLAFFFISLAGDAQERSINSSAFGTATKNPIFVPIEDVEKIIGEEGHIELGYSYFSEEKMYWIRYDFSSIQDTKERLAKEGELSEEGCFFYEWPGDFESSYWPNELVDRAERATISQVACNAHLVLVAKIQETRVGWIGRRLGTLITVGIEETLATTGGEIPTPLHFKHYMYAADIADLRLCQIRPGFYSPKVGDTVLLIGGYWGGDMLGIANLFRVADGEVQPEPYDFITMPGPVSLASIREALASSCPRREGN